ncbi:putative metallopeptidase [Gimesia aquarii]|uniref:Putative phage metallopeptidase domain-containing protein n=1 Tax=Gimesia aquarii TaxID=2527964 RepID=A0A517VPW7_9PLAN|nr:putative metallopeptidase [Gimesia aquarii]QDT95061.1 hypothetical protein V144x_04950 [Gimesia aquarii]QDU07079.1 hypothetical protein V202x_04240 [Gimesia aquarii]
MSTKKPFNFSHAMFDLCRDIAQRMPEFQHIDMDRVAVAFAQARRNVPYGMQAKLTPLRFEKGALHTTRYGRKWTAQRVYQDQEEMLYILTFYLPRFLNHSFQEKLITVVHELYHISPAFDGDIRRLEGHYHVHSHSQKEYDEQMAVFVDQYLKQKPPAELFSFLKCRFSTLQKRHGGVVGLQIPIPKLIPIDDSQTA